MKPMNSVNCVKYNQADTNYMRIWRLTLMSQIISLQSYNILKSLAFVTIDILTWQPAEFFIHSSLIYTWFSQSLSTFPTPKER